jgi:ABC-type multidrug transport system fused ATPase/permease subunit
MQLAFIVIAFVPVLAVSAASMKIVMSRLDGSGQDAYARAGDAAGEALSMVRTVQAYNGGAAEVSLPWWHRIVLEQFCLGGSPRSSARLRRNPRGGRPQVRRYDAALAPAAAVGVRKGIATGVALGVLFFTLYAAYGVGLWYGARLILDSRSAHPVCVTDPTAAGCYSGGNVINTFMAVLIGACDGAARGGSGFCGGVTHPSLPSLTRSIVWTAPLALQVPLLWGRSRQTSPPSAARRRRPAGSTT